MTKILDIAVIGGGAAGLATAIFALDKASNEQRSISVAVLEGAASIGAKILISGGGRCNITHEVVQAADFHGSRPIIRNILAGFTQEQTCRWFRSLGVDLKREETGKLFPVTDRARTIVDALIGRCKDLGVLLLTRHRVTDIQLLHTESVSAVSGFVIHHTQGTLLARRVIMATGGRSLSRTGSDGWGWELLRKLWHTVTATHPALVPLVLEPTMFHAELSGISHIVELTTTVKKHKVDRRTGSLLWTHVGVSGPVVMDSSRFWTIAHAAGDAVEVLCNFCPGEQFADVERWFLEYAAEKPKMSLGKAIAQRSPDRFGDALCRWCGIDSSMQIGQLSQGQRRTLIHAFTGFRLPILEHRGWNFAEVTAGGVPLSEIDYRSMASRRVPGLYLVGELLDCDGRIGGFNFQWAWATGYAAGRAAAASLQPDESKARKG